MNENTLNFNEIERAVANKLTQEKMEKDIGMFFKSFLKLRMEEKFEEMGALFDDFSNNFKNDIEKSYLSQNEKNKLIKTLGNLERKFKAVKAMDESRKNKKNK
mgnify:CR=1 FL=1